MSYFYGPVPSRRLGFSLGVDLTRKRVCSFDCVYCQLGKNKSKTFRRFTEINLPVFKKELAKVVKESVKIDYITISGQGEPTLHKGLDEIIKVIKKITANKYPVCVITNSSFLHRKNLRKELKQADLIVPSLDAPDEKTFLMINRPHANISYKKIITGLIDLRKEFRGQIWLEIMLLKGVNDSIQTAKKFKTIIKKINPDKIQLNIPVRPAFEKVYLPDSKQISAVADIIGGGAGVVLKPQVSKMAKGLRKDLKKKIISFLSVRPASLVDLTSALGANPNEVIKYLYILLEDKSVKIVGSGQSKYFLINDC